LRLPHHQQLLCRSSKEQDALVGASSAGLACGPRLLKNGLFSGLSADRQRGTGEGRQEGEER
jgi:hypothetical protein